MARNDKEIYTDYHIQKSKMWEYYLQYKENLGRYIILKKNKQSTRDARNGLIRYGHSLITEIIDMEKHPREKIKQTEDQDENYDFFEQIKDFKHYVETEQAEKIEPQMFFKIRDILGRYMSETGMKDVQKDKKKTMMW